MRIITGRQRVILPLFLVAFSICLQTWEDLPRYKFRGEDLYTSKTPVIGPLPPVHINSSWIGNQWIPPPGYKLYSSREIQRFFQHHSILFVGDSTARRTYATFYGILNATVVDDVSVQEINDPTLIDIGKGGGRTEGCSREGYSLCRRTHNSSGRVDLMVQTCLAGIADMVSDPTSFFRKDLNKYTLVVFILGPWEVANKWECSAGGRGRKNSTDDFFQALFNVTSMLTETSVIWRTWGSPGTSKSSPLVGTKQLKWANAHNQYVKELIDANVKNRGQGAVSYIDWGQAMLPRLFPQEKRITGDIDPHYGLEARLAFIQMLMNHLVERDRQKRYELLPWADTSQNTSYLNIDKDESRTFMSTTSPAKVLSDEEKRAFEVAKSAFCGECIWSDKISCDFRWLYMKNKHKKPEAEALFSVMKEPACNKSSRF